MACLGPSDLLPSACSQARLLHRFGGLGLCTALADRLDGCVRRRCCRSYRRGGFIRGLRQTPFAGWRRDQRVDLDGRTDADDFCARVQALPHLIHSGPLRGVFRQHVVDKLREVSRQRGIKLEQRFGLTVQ